MGKQTIAVIFGGTSTEHEVSIVSARSVIAHFDSTKFDIIPVYISKNNQWGLLSPDQAAALPEHITREIQPGDLLDKKIDAVFPVLHGLYGEDGTIQGMLDMLHLPFVGCDVLASAMCMDKVVQKQLCLQQGLPIVPFVWTDHYWWDHEPEKTLQYIKNKLQVPLFVKPANQGSSVGITKVKTMADLIPAIEVAFTYDAKVIIEQGVVHPREIECAVLGNHEPQASVLGEIIASNEFYDYDAKYIDGQSQAIIPAPLPAPVTEKIQAIAKKAFTALNCSGLARVDFLVTPQYEIYLSELNTMPGFTTISMYPQLWAATGLSYPALLERLVELAIERYQEQTNRQLSYQPKLAWQRE